MKVGYILDRSSCLLPVFNSAYLNFFFCLNEAHLNEDFCLEVTAYTPKLE